MKTRTHDTPRYAKRQEHMPTREHTARREILRKQDKKEAREDIWAAISQPRKNYMS